jgi:hypothetical protein
MLFCPVVIDGVLHWVFRYMTLDEARNYLINVVWID